MRFWVIDTGVGMDQQELAEANAKLASPPDIDAVTTDRVGFQVVGRLARQLGVSVVLQTNPGGGLAAAVLIPLAVFERDADALPSQDGVLEAVNGAHAHALSYAEVPSVVRAATMPLRRVRPPRREQDQDDIGDGDDGIGDDEDNIDGDGVMLHFRRPAPVGPDGADVRQPDPPLPRRHPGATVGAGTQAATPEPVPAAAAADGAQTWMTADGLVKRKPGGAFANGTAVAADAGVFRRLPLPGADEEATPRRRFNDLSRMQRAVLAAREDQRQTEGDG
jgi:hypothetical protein